MQPRSATEPASSCSGVCVHIWGEEDGYVQQSSSNRVSKMDVDPECSGVLT